MQRDDYPTLHGLGFQDHELQELNLWDVPTGDPSAQAELYLRRSKKKDTLSTLREQVRRMCQQADRDKVRIRHVWFEQKSASKSYVRREEFEKATEAITRAGLSKTLYVFKTSRLSRRGMGQVGLLLDEFEKKQARIYVCAEGIDSRNSRMILAILSEQARDQVSDLSQFVKIGMDANKAEGSYTGGVLPYGLKAENGTQVHNPKEYPTARRIAEYLLDRKTPTWIANQLNSEGLKTRHGKMWQNTGIISLAHAIRWAGLIPMREKMLDENGNDTGKYHKGGTPLLDRTGHPVSAGEGVITFAEHVKIDKILASRAQAGTTIGDRTRGKRETVALLHGIMRCALCKGPMANGGNNYRCYARQLSGAHACLGVSIEKGRADEGAVTLWLNHILSLTPDSPTIHAIARDWLNYQDPATADRKTNVSAALENAVEREMKLSKEYFVLGRLTEEMYESLRSQVAGQITALKAELAELTKEADLSPLMDPGALVALWEGAGIGGQRALLRAALKAGITLLPSKGRGYRTPALERLVPDWKDSEERSDGEWEDATRDIG
ncbi:recombinase family protein [Streptomyces mirabilis]|uniref:recombinase family protein n=1 Tax=Streptomyces mirabilis TaxID=68239 RepID=UPI0036DD1C23